MKDKKPKITAEALERLFAMTPDQYAFGIIQHLGGQQAIRFSRLQVLLGLNPGTLTARLRQLERSGLVRRTVFRTMPPRVDYSLSPAGRSLRQHIASLAHWAETHCPPVSARQLTKPRVQ